METIVNIKNMGKIQKEIFSFISKQVGWQSFDKSVKNVIINLEERNLVDVDLITNQFRLR